jgi:hypothetical protein
MYKLMRHRSPTFAGFRAVLHSPSFALAEIAWRWSFGAALVAAVLFSFREYLGSLPVDRTEMLLLGSAKPVLVGRALEQILRGSAPRLVFCLILLAIVFALAWAVMASLGRNVVVKALATFATGSHNDSQNNLSSRLRFFPLFGLHLLRSSAALAMVIGCAGTGIAAANIASKNPALLGLALLALFVACFLAISIWTILNWLLSFAAIFVVTNGSTVREAIFSAVEFSMQRFAAVLVPGVWFVLFRATAVIAMGMLWIFVASFVPTSEAGIVLGMLAILLPLYWVIADWLYVARLAAYVYLVLGLPDAGVQRELAWNPPPAFRPQDGRIDADELILSDVPST